MADALSRKPIATLASIKVVQLSLLLEFRELNTELTRDDLGVVLVNFTARPEDHTAHGILGQNHQGQFESYTG